jgi:serine/threonine-protein kinase
MALDARRWAALQPIFEQAIELPGAERASLLERVRRDHPDLFTDLDALLGHHDDVIEQRFLEAGPLTSAEAPAHAGQLLGPYTLVSPIGGGGMGSVWLARRNDGRFDRPAAIKLLNVALRGSGKERFTREGRILARLTHPHIAHLLDAGVTTDAQPYLVLEYIDGEPIDRYCEHHALDTRARLALFLEVLDAVSHAHASLIVHRDLKPSNVLVDKSGHVKLLDFGIAKLLDDEAGDAPVTREGESAMTPYFATPEQVSGGSITTATDIYQLGVLLFVMLTGRHPAAAHSTSPAELMKSIIEVEPEAPSTVVDSPRVARLLRGDLDTIVGKALRKLPAERYTSVAAFAADLQRHLDHEPITARPASFVYRSAKFVRRHHWAVAAAAVVFTALAVGLFAVNRERVIAQRRFQQLRELSNEVFGLDSQISLLAGATKAREQLVTVSMHYLEGLDVEAGDDLDLTLEAGTGYWRVGRIQGVPTALNLGDSKKAEATLAKGDALLDRVLAARPHDRTALLRSGAVAHDRMILAQTEHRNADARAYAEKAAARMEALLALGTPSHDEIDGCASSMSNVALAYINMRDYAKGAQVARRAVAIARLQEDSARTVPPSLSLLANALRLQGDLDGSLTAIREARAVADATDPKSGTSRLFDRYGVLYREGLILGEDRAVSLGRSDEAIAALSEAFEISETTARADPNDSTSRTRAAGAAREIGDILRWQHPDQALTYYDRALARLGEIRTTIKARRDRALILANSSYALGLLHRTRDARARIDEALTILTETKDYPAERIVIDAEAAVTLQAKADLEADEGRIPQAIASYEDLLERVLASSPDVTHDMRETYNLALMYRSLADLQRRANHPDEAAALDQKARDLWLGWQRAQPNNQFVQAQLAIQ